MSVQTTKSIRGVLTVPERCNLGKGELESLITKDAQVISSKITSISH